jgi:hypothetical protein
MRPSVERGVSVHVSYILAVAFLPTLCGAVDTSCFRDVDGRSGVFCEWNGDLECWYLGECGTKVNIHGVSEGECYLGKVNTVGEKTSVFEEDLCCFEVVPLACS